MTRPFVSLQQATVLFVAAGLCLSGPARAQEKPADETEAEAEAESTDDPTTDAVEAAGAADGAAGDAPSDAEMEAEMDEGAVNLQKTPPQGKGAIVGVITDTKFSEPLIEARVQVVGQKREVFTDQDGRFRIELPPGTYSLRVTYEMHQPTRVDEVQVTSGKLARLDAQLTPDESAVETVVIEDEVDHTSTEGQTLQRQRSASVGDGVGRAEIARTPDRNAAEAAQRVVGATIVGGRFVYVRGLGERYTNALLNGTPLPSPEPDRQSVPLDLFPSLVLDSITISKQFTPDMPADFAGGSVQIYTREFPRQRLFQIALTGGYNTETTYQNRLASHGSSTDFLGFDDGVRQLPTTIPQKRLTDENAVPAERRYWARWLNSYMSARHRLPPPNHGISIVAGDSWKLSPTRKLGAVAALSYSHNYQTRLTSARRYHVLPSDRGEQVPSVTDTSDGEQTVDGVRIGAFATVALELSKSDKLVLTGLRSQGADDSASELEGFDDAAGATFRSVHLEYVSRALNVLQLRGVHGLKALNASELEWNVSFSGATRDEPDTRDVSYRRTPDSQPLGYAWIPGSNSGSHFYSKQKEDSLGAGLDYTQPLGSKSTKLKLGGLLNSRQREFTARRFVLEPDNDRSVTAPPGFAQAQLCPGVWHSDCPDRVFLLRNIAPGGLTLRETTQKYDGYNASLNVLAGYGMIDFEPLKGVRLVTGARVEHTRQSFTAFSPNDPGTRSAGSILKDTNFLPAVSAVWASSAKSNTRLGLSRTLARPQLREVSPFLSSGYTLDLPVQGNPDLRLTSITNADIRFETFPTLREVLAASVFYKHFTDPIEEVIRTSTGGNLITYENAPKADLVGVELEARKNLEFVAAPLKNFSVLSNFTLAYSRVSFGGAQGESTSSSRPLSLQSPYIVNVSLDYSNADSGTNVRLLYNVYGPRITTVGTNSLPDTYEQPRHVVDLSAAQHFGKHIEFKAAALNLLYSAVQLRYRGALEYLEQGQKLAPGPKDPLVRSYNPGTTFTLTGTYTY